jgi:ribonucleotide monophosphatase NagD (HAD superfamily)
MIGDSLHTDIKGANNFNIDSMLLLSGIHQQDINLSA